MAEEATEALAEFAAGLGYDDIPEGVREQCKDLLLDAVACAVAGHEGEEIAQMSALAGSLACSRESTVIGGDRLSLAGATMLNAYLVTALALCDVHRATMTHVSPLVIPSALAIAERDGSSGRDLLVAVAAGAETALRIATGINYPAFRARGWHTPGVVGPLGAAASAGRLLGLDANRMACALGLAGSQSAGTFAALGTSTFKFHQCRGALAGLVAAILAEQGFTANRNFLTTSEGGLYATYSEGARPDLATADLGVRWVLEEVGLRLWPSATTLQGLATALFDLVQTHDVAPERVAKVRIALGKSSFDVHSRFARYSGKFEALFSAHYVAAAILHDRALTLAQFEPSRHDDPRLRQFAAERVEVRLDPEIQGAEAVVEVEAADGTTFATRCAHPRGAPENPLSRAEIVQKLLDFGSARLPRARLVDIAGTIADLERVGSVAELMTMFRPVP